MMLRRAPSVGAGYRWWAGGEAASCTESLGSESGDVGCDADEIDQLFFPPVVPAPAAAAGGDPDAAGDTGAGVAAPLCGAEEEAVAAAATKEEKGRRAVGFPPAMPRATGALFLRAERRGGRLILTEVRADEHERRVVFRAQRHGGRLRLRFANDDDVGAPERGGETEAGGGSIVGAGAGEVVGVAGQHQHGGGGGGELCQVAGRRGGVVEVGAVMMGTTI